MNDKLGVALTKCFICGEDDRIIINRRLTKHYADKVKEMHGKTIDYKPCNKCIEHMKMGIIVISVDEAKSNGDMSNPYRTGGWWVVKEDFIKKLLEDPSKVLEKRMMFIEHEIAEKIGMFDIETTKETI